MTCANPVSLVKTPKSWLDCGSPGTGLLGHMMGESLRQATGGSMVHFCLGPTAGAACPMLTLRQLQRAVVSLARGASLADAAFDAGFADQAHLNRIM